MYPSIERLRQLLIKENFISESDSKAAEAAATSSAEYVDYLIQHELLSKQLLGHALAESYHLPFADLADKPPAKESILTLPETVARANRLVVTHSANETVTVATDTVVSDQSRRLARLFPKKKVRLTYTLPEYVDAAFDTYDQPLEVRFSNIFRSGYRIAPEIVDAILKDAIAYRASDIHFEPEEKEAVIRFRIDGNLHVAARIDKKYYENILNRLKLESGIRIDEHLAPQDGAIQRSVQGRQVDLRIGLVPTVEGEKAVIRILNSYIQNYTLSDIGLGEGYRSVIESYAAKPFGMILTVGPTGSGKTTTLYALLKMLNRPNVNIVTIEDPVEYKIKGVSQIQVHENSNLTFARGLRAIVRQDPNVILVGEIRDQETAEISVNAALTGHVLLSTLHANDAATAIPRLIDMGIEPFLLASTMRIIVAQRLVRRICNNCRYSLPTSEALKVVEHDYADIAPYVSRQASVYAGKGCQICNNTGYSGRTALFEYIEVTPEMRQLIKTRPTSEQIEMLARKQGSRSMFEDGMDKINAGLTTIEEVARVAEVPAKRVRGRGNGKK